MLWGLAVLAYANSFRAGLIYDNRFVLVQDSRIRQVTEENVHLILTKDYWYKNSVSSLYRPLTTLSYLFNHAILGNGDAPAGYHAVNLVLHAANIALVYLLGWLVLAEFWPAFAMAALWAVHPVLTESVTNVVGRADLLAAFGVLAGLLCYARSVASVGRRAILWQVGVLAASAIAMFSKESGIVIVAAIFLYDIAWLRQAPLRARIAGYLAAVVPIVVFLAVRAQILKDTPLEVVAFTDNPLVGADFWTARLTAVKVLGKYLWLLFWPARLSCDYSFNQIPLFSWNLGRWEDWQALIALAVYTAAAALAVYSYRRSRPVFFLIGFFFAAMAPTANLFLLIGTIMAERLLYLPSVAFAGCLGRLERVPAASTAMAGSASGGSGSFDDGVPGPVRAHVRAQFRLVRRRNLMDKCRARVPLQLPAAPACGELAGESAGQGLRYRGAQGGAGDRHPAASAGCR